MTNTIIAASSADTQKATKISLVTPPQGYSTDNTPPLVPGALLGFSLGFAVYFVITLCVGYFALVINKNSENNIAFLIMAAMLAVGTIIFSVKIFTINHAWSAEKNAASNALQENRFRYMDEVLFPWLKQFNVTVDDEGGSRLLNGEVVPVKIFENNVNVAIVLNEDDSYGLIEVDDVDSFNNEAPKLKTKHYDNGDFTVLSNEASGVLRVRVDSFASYFKGRLAPEGFVDLTLAPGYSFRSGK